MSSRASDINVRVLCRFRPMNEKEQKIGQDCVATFPPDHCTVVIPVQHEKGRGGSEPLKFQFDYVFPPPTSQQEIYEIAAKPVVESFMEGFNGTIFAYGQTSSGKTFTMTGADIDNPELRGIIPRMVYTVFDLIRNSDSHIEYIVKVSYCEIYLERIKDLLNPVKNNLRVKEDKTRGVYIDELTEEYAQTDADIYNYMKIGTGNREVGYTHMNAGSSRSHSIFILSVTQNDTQNLSQKVGKLYLVDLAGSEKVGKTGAEGKRLDEAKNINKSLSALGNVIFALTDGKSKHIPYRDSKLTRVLQDSLGGNSKTSLIITCSPSIYNEQETISTLRFGIRAKSIKNKAKVNREYTVAELKLLLTKAQEQIEIQNNQIVSMQRSLKEAGIEAGGACEITDVDALDDEIRQLRAQLGDEQDKNALLWEQVEQLQKQVNLMADQISMLQDQNGDLESQILQLETIVQENDIKIQDLTVTNETLRQEVDSQSQQIIKKDKVIENMETQLETLRIQATKAVSNEEREAIREEIRFEIQLEQQESRKRHYELMNQIKTIQVGQQQSDIEQQQLEFDKLTQKLEGQFNSSNIELMWQLQAQQQSQEELIQRLEDLQQKHLEYQSKIKRKIEKVNQVDIKPLQIVLQKESQNKVNISGLLIKFDVKDQGSLAIKAQAKNLKLATMNWINLKSKAKELIIDQDESFYFSLETTISDDSIQQELQEQKLQQQELIKSRMVYKQVKIADVQSYIPYKIIQKSQEIINIQREYNLKKEQAYAIKLVRPQPELDCYKLCIFNRIIPVKSLQSISSGYVNLPGYLPDLDIYCLDYDIQIQSQSDDEDYLDPINPSELLSVIVNEDIQNNEEQIYRSNLPSILETPEAAQFARRFKNQQMIPLVLYEKQQNELQMLKQKFNEQLKYRSEHIARLNKALDQMQSKQDILESQYDEDEYELRNRCAELEQNLYQLNILYDQLQRQQNEWRLDKPVFEKKIKMLVDRLKGTDQQIQQLKQECHKLQNLSDYYLQELNKKNQINNRIVKPIRGGIDQEIITRKRPTTIFFPSRETRSVLETYTDEF